MEDEVEYDDDALTRKPEEAEWHSDGSDSCSSGGSGGSLPAGPRVKFVGGSAPAAARRPGSVSATQKRSPSASGGLSQGPGLRRRIIGKQSPSTAVPSDAAGLSADAAVRPAQGGSTHPETPDATGASATTMEGVVVGAATCLGPALSGDPPADASDAGGGQSTSSLVAEAAEQRARAAAQRGIVDEEKAKRMRTNAEASAASGVEIFGSSRRDQLRRDLERGREMAAAAAQVAGAPSGTAAADCPEQTATSAAGPSTPSPSGRAPVPCDLVRRAELLGVSRSLWFDISQRPVGDIAAFLDAAEQPDDPGASSSAG